MTSKKHQLHYTYPPDLQKCKIHRLATRIFKGLDKEDTGKECQCCERKIGNENQAAECCYDTMKLAYLGPGIPLFFTFLKNSIILLVVLTFIFMIFAFYSNIKGGDCSVKQKCLNEVFNTFAIINKFQQHNFLTIQNYTALGFVVITIFLMHYFRYDFRKVEDECDDIITSPSDYALILRRLPQGTVAADIEKMIEDRRQQLTLEEKEKTENLRVINIVLAYSMTQYKKVKQENRQEFYKLLDENRHKQFQPKPLPKLEKTASFAIVIFARQQSKSFFKYKPNIFQKILQFLWTPCIPRSHFMVKGERIAVERAPEPDDIVWENSKISMQGAILRKSLYSLLSILLLAAGGACLYGLAIATVKAPSELVKKIMTTAFSIVVSLLNFIIEIFLIFTSRKQRNQTLTEFNTVLMVKISFFQFLNTGIFVLLTKYLADPQFTLEKGVIYQVTQVMILNAAIPNITLFILSYCEVISRIYRCLIEHGTFKYTQYEANLIYEGPPAEIPYKYAYVFKTIWLTALYTPLVPIVVPISVAGLAINYFLQKFLFGRVYSVPNTMSSMVNDSAIEFIQYVPLIFSLGEFIIYLYMLSFNPELLPTYWSVPMYVSMGLSFLNMIIPMEVINKKLFKLPKDSTVYPSYEKVEHKFEVTYEMTNPGYICQRKRKRDLFVLNKLFTNEITGASLITGGDNINNSLLGGQQNIYSPNNSNPLDALLHPLETNQNREFEDQFNDAGPNITINGIALDMGQDERVKNRVQIQKDFSNKNLFQNPTMDTTQNRQNNTNQNSLQGENQQDGSEQNEDDEEKQKEESEQNQQNQQNQQNDENGEKGQNGQGGENGGESHELTNAELAAIHKKKKNKRPPPPAFGFPTALPPGFNSSFFNPTAQNTQTPINLKNVKLISQPVPIAPQSESSSDYSSTRQKIPAFKIQNPMLFSLSKIEYEFFEM